MACAVMTAIWLPCTCQDTCLQSPHQKPLSCCTVVCSSARPETRPDTSKPAVDSCTRVLRVHALPMADVLLMRLFFAGERGKNVSVAVGISYTEYYLNCVHMGMTAYTATSGTLRYGQGRCRCCPVSLQ